MRFGLRKAKPEPVVVAPPPPTPWTDRFTSFGLQLDSTEYTLRGVAVSVTGSETRVSALGWSTTMYYGGWSPLAATIPTNTILPVHEGAIGLWERRLRGVGEMLDADPRQPINPCAVELDGRVLVTALIDGEQGWEQISWWLGGTTKP